MRPGPRNASIHTLEAWCATKLIKSEADRDIPVVLCPVESTNGAIIRHALTGTDRGSG
jgi:hypothetical protein